MKWSFSFPVLFLCFSHVNFQFYSFYANFLIIFMYTILDHFLNNLFSIFVDSFSFQAYLVDYG